MSIILYVNIVYMLNYICKYIPAYYIQRPNMFKIIELLRTENTFTLKRLRTFIFNVFEIRNINNYT